jgi:ketosteroid isomerase-like protein
MLARASGERGIKAAFLAFLDNESIVFRPHPVNGIEATQAGKGSPASLQWAPAFADIAASGDLAYTTGPWEYRPKGVEDTVVFYGNFISVWKKQDDGSWKVALDIGVSNPRPAERLADVVTAKGAVSQKYNNKNPNLDQERLSLIDSDRDCSRFARENGTIAFYLEYASDSLRFFRDGNPPVIGKPGLSEYYSEHPGLLTWNPFDAIISRSADLGYTYGSAEFKSESPDERKSAFGYYVRIWRKAEGGDWKIVLDVISPAPPPEADVD